MDIDVTKAATLDLLVRVDPDNAIVEADEANNDASLTLPYGQSLDLEVTPADIVQTGASPLAGHDVNFDVSVHNRGTIDSPPAIFHADIEQNGVTTTLFDAPLQIGAGQTVLQHLTWRADQPGAAQLRVSLDPTNQIVETREDNNTAQLDFNVAAQDQPDLTFVSDSLVFDPTPGLQGQPFTASLVVRNLSSVATGSFSVALYAADPRTGVPALGSTIVATLGGSSDTTVTINVADLGITGDQTLYAFIDADTQIAEIDETNNVIIKSLHIVPLPDISISVADIRTDPALPVPGQPVEAQITVKNLGGQDAQNVVVRLREGDATSGVTVGADQSIDTLSAGGSTVLTWNWTLGLAPNTHSVTAIADPDNSVREGSEDNNVASLPYDVQNGDFFASERYISPNGDGVRDQTAIVFVSPLPGNAEVDIVNGAKYTVRHFNDIALNSAQRGQVIWDGRDDHGRIVPDGDYHVSAIDANHQGHTGPLVTVDNNLSSVLEAVDTPYGVYGDLPHDNQNHVMNGTQIPPITSPLRDQLFGFWQSPTTGLGLYRTSTLFPEAVPVISGNWITTFKQTQHLQSASIDRFTFSPDGRDLLVGISTDQKYWIFATAVDQVDAPRPLAVIDNASYAIKVFGYFDEDNAVVGPDSQGLLQLIDVPNSTTQPLRSYPDIPDFDSNPSISVLPDGILFSGQKYTNDGTLNVEVLLPKDAARPLQHLSPTGDYSRHESWLSPGRKTMAVDELSSESEKVDLIDLASGARKTLVQADPIAVVDPNGFQHTKNNFGIDWVGSQGELVVQDAKNHTISTYSENGQRITQTTFPALQRVGNYVADSSETLPDVPDNLFEDDCGNFGNVFDPTTNRFYLRFGESVPHFYVPEVSTHGADLYPYIVYFDPGIRDYYSADVDSGAIDPVQKGTLIPLVKSADIAVHPLRQACDDSPPPDWPSMILSDGARTRLDGYVQTLSRGVLPKPWADRENVLALWPDETRLLLRNSRIVFLAAQFTARLQPNRRAWN